MTVRGYLRVSSAQQVENHSLGAQRDRIERWAAYQNLSPLVIYEERGGSGKRDDWPQHTGLLAGLHAGWKSPVKIDAVSEQGRKAAHMTPLEKWPGGGPLG